MKSHPRILHKPAKSPERLIAHLNQDPRMPGGSNICRELCINKGQRSEFAEELFDFVQDPVNKMLMRRKAPKNFLKLAARFLLDDTKLYYWPTFLVETNHKWFKRL
jgi:hypothetical protein